MTKVALVFCFISCLLANSNNSNAQTQPTQPLTKKVITTKEKWHWGNAQQQNNSAGYTQVVKTGNTLYISGIPTSDLSPKGVAKLYEALGECLKAFGASSKNVVKETLYTTDIEAMKQCNGPRKEFYQGDFPAASWVQVSRLYEPNAKLEVDLVAQLDGSKE
ncbi:RidA family protein [Chitinophaga varians]|uniref:RidA family protein n=1 Tax=Chitinophaga varians TaxID=2202339 RepID=UPI00165EBF97|nr:RidA family protein [Chitinophaga varians]MBC9909001.1 RidA family protein [Chitinophaga varians]